MGVSEAKRNLQTSHYLPWVSSDGASTGRGSHILNKARSTGVSLQRRGQMLSSALSLV